MAVTFSADGAVGTITLDNPPANSYDLEFMQRVRGATVDAAIDVATSRVVVVRSREREVLLGGRRRQAVPRRRRRRRTWR